MVLLRLLSGLAVAEQDGDFFANIENLYSQAGLRKNANKPSKKKSRAYQETGISI